MPPRKRLDSWKEIAAYFERDVRTVKRWEESEGLPVHRHLHKTLASVYAWEDELREWQLRRTRPNLKERQREPPPVSRPGRRILWGGAAAMLALAIAFIVFRHETVPSLPFQERDWALITEFENRTAETLFDGSVEYALERELSNSRFVNVVPAERIADALQLMRAPSDTRIDRNVGREVCLRDGGIRVLISGRVESIGGTYVISADLIDPPSGTVVGNIAEKAAGHEEVVNATARLSQRLRRMLGEQLARSPLQTANLSPQPLERVSTPSLRALQLYSQADALVRDHKTTEAAALLEEAVRDDPSFASAHLLLGHAYFNSGRGGDAAAHFRRAEELADTTTDRERLFILASSYQKLHDDGTKAVETLELLNRLDGDHYWAVSNLMFAYYEQNRIGEALPLTVRRAALRPNNFDHQLSAAQALLVAGDPKRASELAARAERILAAEREDPFKPWRAARLRLYPAQAKWLRAEWNAALQEATSIGDTLDGEPATTRTPLAWEVGSFHLVLGRHHDARRFFDQMHGSPENAALIALATGDLASMNRHLKVAPASHRTAILLARAGRADEAMRLLEHPQLGRRAYAPFLPVVWKTLAQGEIAHAQGRSSEAILLFERSVRMLRGWPTPFYFLAVDGLSHALELDGQHDRSLAVLETAAIQGPGSIFWGPAPLFFMKNELRRADLYRRAGQEDEARRIEAGVRERLALADPDFPLLQRVARR